MGIFLFDQYSLLHMATGIIAYFWGIKLKYYILLHIAYEYLENTQLGMSWINQVTFFPGGKNYPDSLINSSGDIISGILGWLIAKWLDDYGSRKGWFSRHL